MKNSDSGARAGALEVREEQDPLLHRLMPSPDPAARFFWMSGADGRLRIEQCDACEYLVHPPSGHCPRCGGDRCTPRPVSGRGTIHSYTVNYQQWFDGQPPYIIIIIDLDEQAGLRLTSNLLDCAPEDVFVGMRVSVRFLARHGVWYPVFVPSQAMESDSA
ncbi:Zn-ribbon domain-containing OB-fold protein [Rhodococcus sp. NPDC059968]|uniref:Zn-ribbon domain-containing OB-fold protein n=1 Tax=Rhodococcus sp. NPDC059968 TaxID=3347017 RepID=UPI00366CC994